MAKKLSEIRLQESESVKRTQTNLKNIQVSKTGYSTDDDEYKKHIERMKKARDEYIKNNPNTIYKRNESVEAIDEISDELANKVKDKRTEQGRNWRQNPKWAAKSSKNFALNLARTARKEKNKVDSPEVSKIKKSANAEYEYNRSRGYSNESVEVNEAEKMKGEDPCWKNYQMVGTKKKNGKEVPNCVPVKEAFGATASNRTHEGSFQEKQHGKHFTYKKTNDAWAKKHNLPHEIDVHDGVRYGHVKGTVAHIATDENPNGSPKLDKWKLKNHKKWMKESRTTDIVREAYLKAKSKKKNEENDKEVSGKVQKFEADPVLSDTLQKQ
jgi:hypothetical protein